MRSAAGAVAAAVLAAIAALTAPVADARPSDPGVVSYAVLGKGSVGNVVGAPMAWESTFTAPFQGFYVDLPVCNNWADIGLPEVYLDPDLASFNGAVAQRAANDDTNLVKQAVGVFATNDAALRAFQSGDRSDRGLRRADHRHASGGLHHAGLVVLRRRTHGQRRGVGEAGSGYRPPVLHSNQAARERSAASESLPAWKRRTSGERAGGGDAEHARAVAVTAVPRLRGGKSDENVGVSGEDGDVHRRRTMPSTRVAIRRGRSA